MTRRNVGTTFALACGFAVAGCQAAPPSATPAGQAPAPAAHAERGVQGLDQAGFERMMQRLPKQISNADAERMLVKLPADKVQAPVSDIRHTGYRVAGGEAMGDGHGDGQAMSDGHGEGQAMGHGDGKAMDHGDGKAMGYGHGQAMGANLDYRFLSVGNQSLPYVSYYPYVYNRSNNHWAPYAAYASGRYYYPYYQGYGSMYYPYSYSQTSPYAGVYALRSGTILR